MTATSSTAPMTRGGAQKNHNVLLTLSRQWFERNQSTVANARQRRERMLLDFAQSLEEIVGQLEEPGFPNFMRREPNLFTEQPGLPREQAETIVLFYIDELIASAYTDGIATEIEGWLKKTMEREAAR